MLIPTRILVPTDFSEYSDLALAQGLDIAKQYNAKAFLLHVTHEEIPHRIDVIDVVTDGKLWQQT